VQRDGDTIWPKRSEAEPAKTPHLHIRTVEGSLLDEAVAITGNAKAFLQLRAQINRAFRNETAYPFEEGVYHDANGSPFEVAIKRARSKKEIGEPTSKPEKTAEQPPWAEIAGEDAAEKKQRAEGGDG
jgi:hypothetical protein